MYLFHLRSLVNHLTVSLFALAVLAGGSLAAAPSINAQTEPNQSYSCGAYGAGSFGGNDCVATEVAPTVAVTSPPEADGSMPDTGAILRRWAAVGALLVSIGLALYGSSRRRRHLSR